MITKDFYETLSKVLLEDTSFHREVSEDDLKGFVIRYQKQSDDEMKKFGSPEKQWKVITYEIGKVYARLVSDDKTGGSRSALGFVDMKTGNLHKAAGWKAPAKNFTRGNIFDDKGGLARARWTGIQ